MDSFLALGLGYLLGSVPFGLILTRMFGTVDLRSIGSGNIGATNVLRTGNKGLAAATLLLDAAKGFAAVWLGAWISGLANPEGEPIVPAVLGGLAALVGHCFPLWLGFKGGKGVATMLGVAFAADWRIGMASIAVWLAAALLTRISSVGGLTAAATAPIAAYFLYFRTSDGLLELVKRIVLWNFGLSLTVMALIVFWQHRANIARLIAGTEPKIGQKTA